MRAWVADPAPIRTVAQGSFPFRPGHKLLFDESRRKSRKFSRYRGNEPPAFTLGEMVAEKSLLGAGETPDSLR